MRKIFSLLAAVLFAGSMMADPIVINASDVTTIASGATSGLDVTLQGINIVWQGAYYNSDGGDGGSASVDFRVYANKSMTLTAESNISKVEIAGYCKAGLTVTANAGTITTGASYASETTKGTLEDPLIVVDEIGATSVTLTCTKQMRAYTIRVTLGEGETPSVTTYTLQLVADPEKGSVAVTNLLGSDIIDNGNGNYTVPENAEVTILATPLEGYEFTGWKVGNIEEMVGCYYCGTAVNTEDNPYTFTMTADVAYLAEFEAAAPQPDPTVMFIAFPTENRPENIELAGVNREFTWEMVALDNDPWYVSKEHLNTYATDTIKFRDAANNAKILCEFIPANGDQEGRWQQLYLVMGDYPMDSYKLDIVRYIDELDLSNASSYAWMENAPEPLPEPTGIENIVLTEKAKKVVVDGMVYIVRDGKLFNMTGAQVK